MEKERIEYIDAIKGFAIFLMVMGHVIAWNFEDYNQICIYDVNQSINVKIGGGDMATNLFIPHAIVFHDFWLFNI